MIESNRYLSIYKKEIQVLLTLGLKMYKRIPFGDSRIAESLVGMAISLAYQPIARRAEIHTNFLILNI